jgi:hypothetical protein
MPPRDTSARPVAPVPEVGTAILSGRVVAAETGLPLRRATVSAMSTRGPDIPPRGAFFTPQRPFSARTDDDGRFMIRELPAGEYALTARRSGYVDQSYGQVTQYGPGRRVSVATTLDGTSMHAEGISLTGRLGVACPSAWILALYDGSQVNAGDFGAKLKDPMKLLQGTGKRMRHVKLKPGVLKDCQDAVVKAHGEGARFHLVFHGGSGSTQDEIHESLDYGVVKMNVDTDMQYAFTRAVAGHMFKHYDGVLKVDGEVGNKKVYDPRSYLALAEESMSKRVQQAASDLRGAGQTMFAK